MMCALYAAGLLGVTSDKLPVEIHENMGGRQTNSSVSYTYNDNGSIKTQTINSGNRTAVVNYAY